MRNNDTEQTTKYDSREKVIVHVGIWGIVVNFVYAIFKGIIGLASGSIAIFLDAINNLSDAISSIIAVGGTKLAMKPADKFHPFGHGRIEYVSAMAMALSSSFTPQVVVFAKATLPKVTTKHATWVLAE